MITQAIQVAKENGFDGIVLDLEVKAIPTEKVISQITTFVRRFSIAATEKNIEFGMTVYGDTFYRARPFDLKGLEPYVDQFYIMAYDFSKTFGTPGPNFPLSGKETFGYDLTTLTADLSFIEPKKLTLIFGMYGYDWLVDEKKRPIRPAKALPLKAIREQFLKKCEKKKLCSPAKCSGFRRRDRLC
jgi:spore germination protein YaaH